MSRKKMAGMRFKNMVVVQFVEARAPPTGQDEHDADQVLYFSFEQEESQVTSMEGKVGRF
jgi:hypothetical protein